VLSTITHLGLGFQSCRCKGPPAQSANPSGLWYLASPTTGPGGGRPESAFEGLKQHPAQDRACCAHWHTRRVSPISRFAANRGPVSRFPAESENGGFPDSSSDSRADSDRVGNRPGAHYRGFPPRFPANLAISHQLGDRAGLRKPGKVDVSRRAAAAMYINEGP
jgi:hypothetical protein